MVCPKCKEEGRKSTLTGGMTTSMNYPNYYDVDGNYHHHDLNTTTTHYKCSNGHKLTVSKKGTCPSYPEHCDFHSEPRIAVS